MATVGVAEAKAPPGELLDHVERGEEVVITRRGKPVAKVAALAKPRPPLDLEALARLRASAPYQDEDSVALIRRIRDTERY